MANTISPNMNLVVPTVGEELGPTWASDLNADLSILDGHNHSSGQGVPIQPNGLNINSDLSFQDNNATNLRSSRYSPQAAALALVTDVGCVYVVNNELYYNDVNGGNSVQITNNGSVNAGAGSISGLPSGSASASYAAGTFTWQSATATAANMDFASAVLRNNTASSKGLTLQPPSAMAADYSLTLPPVPGITSFMTLDTSGNMAAGTYTASQFITPAGIIVPFGGSSAPSGWLLCNGSAVSRSTYSTLFGVIGTTYGTGDGSTTFNLPDTRGIFVRGAGTNGTLTNANGTPFSATLGATQNDAFQGHIHNQLYTTSAGGSQNLGSAVADGTNTYTNGISTTGPIADGTNGSPRTSTETRPANIAFNYLIKT